MRVDATGGCYSVFVNMDWGDWADDVRRRVHIIHIYNYTYI